MSLIPSGCLKLGTVTSPFINNFTRSCALVDQRHFIHGTRSFPWDVHGHGRELNDLLQCQPGPTCPRLVEWFQSPAATNCKKKTLKKTLRILERMQEKMVHLWNLKAEPELLFFILKTHRCCDFCTRKNNKIVSKHKVCQVTCMPFSRSWTLYGLGLPKKSSGRSSAKEHKGLLKLPWNPVDFCPGIWFKYIWTILSSCHLDSGFIRDKHIE